jgi:hypothetical protein
LVYNCSKFFLEIPFAHDNFSFSHLWLVNNVCAVVGHRRWGTSRSVWIVCTSSATTIPRCVLVPTLHVGKNLTALYFIICVVSYFLKKYVSLFHF